MNIIVTQAEGNITICALSGRMDAETAPQFSNEGHECIAAGNKKILVDMSGLEYISSAGLRAVLLLQKECLAAAVTLGFCGMRDMVRDIFRLSCFDSILSLYDSQENALTALRG